MQRISLPAAMLAVATCGTSISKALSDLAFLSGCSDPRLKALAEELYLTSSALGKLGVIVALNNEYERDSHGDLRAAGRECEGINATIMEAIYIVEMVSDVPQPSPPPGFDRMIKWVRFKSLVDGDEGINKLLERLDRSTVDLGVLHDMIKFDILSKLAQHRYVICHPKA